MNHEFCISNDELNTTAQALENSFVESPGIITLIGKTVHEIVVEQKALQLALGGSENDQKYDFIIEIYSPSCPHCKALEPYYNAMATVISDAPDNTELKGLKVAKINGAQNDVPINGIQIPGFPAIFYVPAVGNPIHIDLAPPGRGKGYGKRLSSLLTAIMDQPRMSADAGTMELLKEKKELAIVNEKQDEEDEASAAEQLEKDRAQAEADKLQYDMEHPKKMEVPSVIAGPGLDKKKNETETEDVEEVVMPDDDDEL